jgi:hypothetical protein
MAYIPTQTTIFSDRPSILVSQLARRTTNLKIAAQEHTIPPASVGLVITQRMSRKYAQMRTALVGVA